jgi:ubiquinone/menaquinone biosynthesis C-methylase UbiE
MSGSEIHCADCRASFPVKDGVIDLLSEFPSRRTLSQAVMEWEPFIKMYESRWFRRGPGMRFFCGISFDEEYEIIGRAARLEGSETLLDLGCGSGTYSRPLAKTLNRGAVVGLDVSVPMLDYASSRARAEQLENLLLIHGSALDLPFPKDEFDAVNCCATIHLFSIPDLLKALKEVCRVLKPGGRFMTSCLRNWIPGQRSKQLLDWYSERIGTYYRRPEDLEKLFKDAGLNDVECHHARRYWMVMSAGKPE